MSSPTNSVRSVIIAGLARGHSWSRNVKESIVAGFELRPLGWKSHLKTNNIEYHRTEHAESDIKIQYPDVERKKLSMRIGRPTVDGRLQTNERDLCRERVKRWWMHLFMRWKSPTTQKLRRNCRWEEIVNYPAMDPELHSWTYDDKSFLWVGLTSIRLPPLGFGFYAW